MKKLAFCLTLLVVAGTFLPLYSWTREYGLESYGEGGYWGEQTADGGFIVSGCNSCTSDWVSNLWLLKLDAEGDTQWTRTYGDPGLWNYGNCVRQTHDGGFIVTGRKGVSYHPYVRGNLWLIKTDSFGDTVWTRNYSDYGDSEGFSVLELTSGDFVVAGYAVDTTLDWSFYLWLLKVNENGDTIWTRRYEGFPPKKIALAQTYDEGYVIAGSTNGDVFLLKTDSNGDSLWTRNYAFYDGSVDEGVGVLETSSGGYLILSNVEYSGDYFTRLIKTNSDGDTMWTRLYGNYQISDYLNKYTTAAGFTRATDGGYVITGGLSYFPENDSVVKIKLWLFKVDDKGDSLWGRIYESGTGSSVQPTKDGGYFVAGGRYHRNEDLDCQVWLLKTDENGDTTFSALTEKPVQQPAEWEILSDLGTVRLQYSDFPNGFRATVFDASGRRVDELKSPNQNGVLIWGEGFSSGVYFVVPEDAKASTAKVVLVK